MPLPRAQRVRRTADFDAVRQKGASWNGVLLIIAVLPLNGETSSRFGFTVTRRFGNAVVRNKVRRRLAAIVASQSALIIRPHLIVSIPRSAAGNASFDSLKAEWIKLARRAGLLPKAP